MITTGRWGASDIGSTRAHPDENFSIVALQTPDFRFVAKGLRRADAPDMLLALRRIATACQDHPEARNIFCGEIRQACNAIEKATGIDAYLNAWDGGKNVFNYFRKKDLTPANSGVFCTALGI